MKKNITLNTIFYAHWDNFCIKYSHKIRDAIHVAVAKLLSCRTILRGFKQYRCQNLLCQHTHRIFFSCKGRACSSCGKKATEIWIKKQYAILPATHWQHITFTMPRELWDFFWLNRILLNKITALAAKAVLSVAQQKDITPGLFTALHTFGRDLKRNVHVHLSVTAGGLTKGNQAWASLYFPQKVLMQLWRYNVISLFREAFNQNQLNIPLRIAQQFNHTFTFQHFLDSLYKKIWIVFCAQTSDDHRHNVNYLGKYVKRPPIAQSKLRHYSGKNISFRYLDHTSKSYKNLTLSPNDFIAKFIQHIPDENFRMIRYYGFLANSRRGKLLPLVHEYLGLSQIMANDIPQPTYAQLMLKDFGIDPFICPLCGFELIFEYVRFEMAITYKMLNFASSLRLQQLSRLQQMVHSKNFQ